MRGGVYGELGIRQSLGGAAGANQQGCVVNEDGGIFGLVAQRVLEITLRLSDVAVLEFKFSCDEIRGRGEFGFAFAFKSREGVGINYPFSDNL